MKIFLIIMMGITIPVFADFNRNTSGIVIDSNSKLQWQDKYNENGGEAQELNYAEAIAYCENLVFAGKNDWRLPNINELRSIVDDTKFDPPLDSAFQMRSSNNFWSSTNVNNFGSRKVHRIRTIMFYSGNEAAENFYDENFIRCVR